MPSRPRESSTGAIGAARTSIFAAVVGLLIGVVTAEAQGVLPDDWNVLANSGAVWLIAPFLMGALTRAHRWAALVGGIALLATVTGYYGMAELVNGTPESTRIEAVWTAMALFGGPLFGVGGFWWRRRGVPWNILGVALSAGVFLAEGVFQVTQNSNHLIAGWIEVAIGVVLPLAIGRSTRDRILGLLSLVPLTLAGVAVYFVLDTVLAHVA